LHLGLLKDLERANWPELAGHEQRIKAKKAWRKREADALSKFLSAKSIQKVISTSNNSRRGLFAG
jgi:hypothetical protein